MLWWGRLCGIANNCPPPNPLPLGGGTDSLPSWGRAGVGEGNLTNLLLPVYIE